MNIKEDSYTVAAIVARFQVHELTEAHKELIQAVVNKHPKVLIFLGLSPLRGTTSNPLDYQPRRQMILEAFPSEKFPNITIGYIKDTPDDKVWSSNLDNLIEDITSPGDSVVLYGGRDSFLKVYSGKFPTRELISSRFVSGTQIRKMISEKPTAAPLFRAGAIWLTHQRFPTAYSTVDIAVYRDDTDEALFARKDGEKLLRFVGGFVSPSDDSFEDAASRELEEETGLLMSTPTVEYLGSFKIDDWRYRTEVDKIITHFYLNYYSKGMVTAADDVAEVSWVAFKNITESMIVPEHHVLWRALVRRLKKTKVKMGDATFHDSHLPIGDGNPANDNEECSCGSGKTYKNCCYQKAIHSHIMS